MHQQTMVKISIVMIMLLTISGCYDKPLSTAIHAQKSILAAAISADGRFSLVASTDHGANLWDIERKQLLYTWDHGKKDRSIYAVGLAADASVAVTAERHALVVWDVKTGQSLGYYQMPSEIRRVAVSTHGRYGLIGLSNHTAVYLDLLNGQTLQTLAHDGAVVALALSRDNRYALTGAEDGMAILWDLTQKSAVHHWPHQHAVNTVALSPDNRYALTASGQDTTLLWNMTSGKVHRKLSAQKTTLQLLPSLMTVSGARFSDNGRYLLTGNPPQFLRLWRTKTGTQLKSWAFAKRSTWKPRAILIYAIAFSPDNRRAITESSDGLGRIVRLR